MIDYINTHPWVVGYPVLCAFWAFSLVVWVLHLIRNRKD